MSMRLHHQDNPAETYRHVLVFPGYLHITPGPSPVQIDSFLPLYLSTHYLCSHESRTLANVNSFSRSMSVRLTAVSRIASSSQDKFPRSVESLSRVSYLFFVSICLDILLGFLARRKAAAMPKYPPFCTMTPAVTSKQLGAKLSAWM